MSDPEVSGDNAELLPVQVHDLAVRLATSKTSGEIMTATLSLAHVLQDEHGVDMSLLEDLDKLDELCASQLTSIRPQKRFAIAVATQAVLSSTRPQGLDTDIDGRLVLLQTLADGLEAGGLNKGFARRNISNEIIKTILSLRDDPPEAVKDELEDLYEIWVELGFAGVIQRVAFKLGSFSAQQSLAN